MKAERDHRIPLSEAALVILAGIERSGARVFPGMGQHAILKAVQRVEMSVSAHGFRSTFSDWCAEQTAFPSEVREMALAHSVGDKVEEAYRRGDLLEKRRQVMDAWARYCAEPQSQRAGKVVAIGDAR
jgi:integrase